VKRIVRTVAIVIGALALIVTGWMRLPNSLFYRDRRPTRFGRWTNRAMAAWYATRLTPSMMSTLEVRRRRSGGVQSSPIVVAEYDGAQYLVSMLGERSEWVRNVRASGGAAVIRHGRARPVRLAEVPVVERAPIIKAYLGRAIGARPHIAVDPRAPVSEFERVAADHPVFRISAREGAAV
jgi:hypothetical protein